MILASNGIQTRHYAIDRGHGEPTHTNAQLAAEAVRRLSQARWITPSTSMPLPAAPPRRTS